MHSNTKTTCKVDWCVNVPNRSGKGYCRRHYDQMRKHGRILDDRTTRDPNDIEVHGDLAFVVLRNIKGIEVARAIVDVEDLEIVTRHKWSLHSNGYARALHNGTTIYLHRVVMRAQTGDEIDHVNQDKLDNRKTNLRFCEHAENCWNRRSEMRGVRLSKRNLKKRHYATITVRGQTKYLGYYATRAEALSARLRAEKKYHGEFRVGG